MGKDINKVKFLTSSADEVKNLVYNAYNKVRYSLYKNMLYYVCYKTSPEFYLKDLNFKIKTIT